MFSGSTPLPSLSAPNPVLVLLAAIVRFWSVQKCPPNWKPVVFHVMIHTAHSHMDAKRVFGIESVCYNAADVMLMLLKDYFD